MEAPNSDPFTTPLGPAPPGEHTDFENGRSQSWQPRVVIYVTLPLVIICVALRVYARFRLQHGFKADDYATIITGLCSVAFCGLLLPYVLKDVLGRHYWDIPIATNTIWVDQMSAALASLYCVAAATMKIAICLFYYRIFSTSIWSRVLIRIAVIFTAITYSVLLIVWLLYAVPRPGENWRSPKFLNRVLTTNAIIITTLSCASTVLDFYILFIPLFTIAKLNIAAARKIMLSMLFLIGLVACIFSAVGIEYRLELQRSVSSGLPDYRWKSMPAYALTVAEINLGIICACLPVIFPLGKGWVNSSKAIWSSLVKSLLSRPTALPLPEGRSKDTSALRQELPQVPRGTFSRLWTLLRTRDSPTEAYTHTGADHIELGAAPYSELRSIDFDYHKHLKMNP